MPKSLTELTTNEVSLVTRGAVNRRFALKKQDTAVDQILKAVLEQEAEGEAQVLAALAKSGTNAKGIEAARAAYRLLSGFQDELPFEAFAKAAPKMAGDKDDDAEKAKKTKKAKPPVDGDEGDGDDDGDEDEDNKFPPSKKKKAKTEKSADMPVELREQFEAVAKAQQEAVEKAERLEKALQAERDVRLSKEFVEKAQREFGTLGPASEVGPVLKSLHAMGGDVAAKVERLLKTAAERANQASLFGERGRDASLVGRENSAWGRIEKAAEELVSKSTDITKAQAIDIVMKRQPELYEEYRAENNHFRVGGR